MQTTSETNLRSSSRDSFVVAANQVSLIIIYCKMHQKWSGLSPPTTLEQIIYEKA